MQPPPLGIVLETLGKLSIGSKHIFIAREGVVNFGGSGKLLLLAWLFSEVSSQASRRV